MNFGMEYGGDDSGGFQSTGGGYGMGDGGGGDGGGMGGSSQTQQRERLPVDEQTIVPVTIKMALSAQPSPTGDEYSVLPDGRKLSLIKFVAAVREFMDHSTNVVYKLEDGTGCTDIKQWLNEDSCSAVEEIRQQSLRDNIYVKVVAKIKQYNGQATILANSVLPISSGNELTHHMLSVVYEAESFKRADSIVAPVSSMQADAMTFGGSMQQMSGGGMGVGVVGDEGNSFDGRTFPPFMVQEVKGYIKQHEETRADGADLNELIPALSHYPRDQIKDLVSAMAVEGIIYSTTADHFYKFC
uniref:Replication protein A C-terminal domain-containing protein n=1 Tax=Craspedostauros australis TaxID=1486917 RepID=A0A7R9X0S9_9STRA|mmetsp:Transcript_4445/g.11675  ORF Transcript_4445/g.11675 Transcript_4445/m.11675 type:complete len:299 (+) Transcript_4445:137-1033(+)|eukprot:CAMPEP_0198112048 /NCGR_PEP_ID=MMETSP1442-20131203/3946_1 /TAXON_ID= /ORGANISM="Craspedostauros australis, Strain CCMP3328" /LENGTH=298 /DNA_ID=CAMNT_0043768691 /DNA_START=34 /DNA_END=930 /DNA_ORIENTATION=+